MGSYTDLSIGGYPVLQTKGAVDHEVMTIFRESDKRVFPRLLSERNELVWGKPDTNEEDEIETAVLYASDAHKVADRLDIMGFTMARVRHAFEPARTEARATVLRELTFERYVVAVRRILRSQALPWRQERSNGKELDPVARFLIQHFDEYVLAFLSPDVRVFLRLACDLVGPESAVVQDITELVASGYYDQDQPVCSQAVCELVTHPESSPFIILTEGSTDIEILRSALEILYPHLADYYTFFDFKGSRSPGGASNLVSIVKAFIAAGISNRTIALFDNDTAAREARQALRPISLPPNIVVLHYPELDMLRSYPTIGPSGPSKMDINGRAASIEMYLGTDVLSTHGELSPVHWNNFSPSVGAYHGVVAKKQSLLAAFRNKVDRCREGLEETRDADWVGLDAILRSAFGAFT